MLPPSHPDHLGREVDAVRGQPSRSQIRREPAGSAPDVSDAASEISGERQLTEQIENRALDRHSIQDADKVRDVPLCTFGMLPPRITSTSTGHRPHSYASVSWQWWSRRTSRRHGSPQDHEKCARDFPLVENIFRGQGVTNPIEYLGRHLSALRDFYLGADDRGLAVVLWWDCTEPAGLASR